MTLEFVRRPSYRYIFLFDTLNDDAYETEASCASIMIQIQVVSIPQFTQKMSRSIFPAKVFQN